MLKGVGNGQINWSQSSQPQAQATDQERTAAAKQAEEEKSVGAITATWQARSSSSE